MPYRAPGPGDKRVDWILREINKAQATLDARVEEVRALPDAEPSKASRLVRLNAMKREVDTAFIDLEDSIGVWANRDLRNLYQRGQATAASQLGAGFSFTVPHREALDSISTDAFDDVATGLTQVREEFDRKIKLFRMFDSLDPSQVTAIRQQGRSVVAQMLLTGEDPRRISKALADDLMAEGITIQDSAGRRWNPEAYTRMLVRTKSANAYNTGSLSKYFDEGVERVQVFDGVEYDQECADANGQVWSLKYALENPIQHPNCRRAFAPKQGKGAVDKASESALPIPSVSAIDAGLKAILTLPHLVDLLEFRRTGELDFASPLARFVVDGITGMIGRDMPQLENLAVRALSAQFDTLETWVESYVDPVLFASGIIKEVPSKAQMAAMGSSENVVREFSIDLARRIFRFRDEHPQVNEVIKVLNDVADQADRVVSELTPVAGRGAIGWIPYIGRKISTSKYGQQIYWTLQQENRGLLSEAVQQWDAHKEWAEPLLRQALSFKNTGRITLDRGIARLIADEISSAVNPAVGDVARAALLRQGYRKPNTLFKEIGRLLEKGEVNASSVLAKKIVEEGREALMDFLDPNSPLRDVIPVVEETGLHALAASLKSVDRMIESYIDPILYQSGILSRPPRWLDEVADDAPLGELLDFLPHPRELVDSIAAMAAAGSVRLGVEYPGVREALVRLRVLKRSIEDFDLEDIAPVTGEDPLAWLSWVSDHLDPVNRYSQILSETLKTVERGEFRNLKRIWDESADYVDQMREIKSAFLRSVTDNQLEAMRVYREMDEVLTELASLLDSRVDINNLPALKGFLEEWGRVRKQDLANLFEYWSDPTRVSRLNPREVRQMEDIYQAATQVRDAAARRIQLVDEIINRRAGDRLLPMAAPSGPDFISEINTLWDLDEFDEMVEWFADGVLHAVRGEGDVIDFGVKDSFGEFFRLFSFSVDDVPEMERHRELLAQFLKPSFKGLEGFVSLDDIPTIDDQLDFFISLLSRLSRETDTGAILFDGDVVTDTMAVQIGKVMRWLDPDYWENPMRWRPVADLHWNKYLLDDHFVAGVVASGPQAKNLFSGLVRAIEKNSTVGGISKPFSDLENLLRRTFGASAVDTLGGATANGTLYTVTNEAMGQTITIKRVVSGHQGGTTPALLSHQLTNYLSDSLGNVEALPYRYVQLTDDSHSFLVISPMIHEAEEWAAPLSRIRDDSLRKFTLFDFLSLERDAHGGNFMINPYTTTSVVIDREMSFGVGRGLRYQDSPDFGIATSSPRQILEQRLVDAWQVGDDIDLDAPPVRLVPITEDEVAAISGLSPSDIQAHVLSWPGGRKTAMTEHGIVFDDSGNAFIPTGRIGRTISSGVDEWYVSVFPTDNEFRFLERIHQPGVDYRDLDEWHEIRRNLEEVYNSPGVTSEAKDDFIRWWQQDGRTFEEALDVAADEVVTNIFRRTQMGLEGGMLNVSGGAMEHVDEITGEVLEYGKTYTFVDEAGESVTGLVVNIFEADLESGVRSVTIIPEIGLGKSLSELNEVSVFPRRLKLDEWRWGSMTDEAADDLSVTIARYEASATSFQEVISTPRNVGKTRLKPIVDSHGMRVGRAEETVELDFQDQMSTLIKIVGNDGAERLLTFQSIIETPALQRVIREEIANVPPELRPKRVKLSFNKLTTSDGKSAFGLFDPNTGDLHLSLAPLFDTPQLSSRGDVLWPNSWFYDASIDDWSLSSASVQHWIETMNIDGVRSVVQHELGHSVGVGLERNTVNNLRLAVLRQLRDEFPEARRIDDVEEIALSLLPDGFDASDFDTALDALVAHRAGIVEDVINTNMAVAAKEILESGLDTGELPAWARAVYAGVLREEPEAHHELFAELWRRLRTDTLETTALSRHGIAEGSFGRVADELGVSEDLLRNFMLRGGDDVPVPEVWDLSDDVFIRWITDTLDPRATRIIPLEKNQNRLLWSAERYSRPDIRTRVLHTPAEEGGGGITINLVTGEEPETGFAVAKHANGREFKNVTTDEEFEAILDAYLDEFEDQLTKEEWMLGIWLEEDTGTLYLDTAKVFDDEIDAAVFGFREQQLAMHRLDDHVDLNLIKDHATVEEYLQARGFDLPYKDLIARTRKLGGVVANTGSGSSKVIEEVFEPRGNRFRVMSLEWMKEADQEEILDTLQNRYTKAITREEGKQNLIEILERGKELYESNPDLQREHKDFYFFWRDTFVDAAAETVGRAVEVRVDWIAAAAARMSPALIAESNLVTVLNFADILSRDVTLTSRMVDETKASINRSIDGAKQRLKGVFGRGKEAREKRIKIRAEIARLEEVRDSVRVGDRLNTMDPYKRVRSIAGVIIAEDRAPMQVSRAWAFFEDSVAVILGEVSPHEVLTDTKIRPFYNNIMDPADILDMKEVTIDFLMAEAFFQARGFNDVNWTTPTKNKVSIGLRPIISDTLRELFDEGWGEELGLEFASQLQSHIWNLWRYGVANGWWTDLEKIRIKKK